MNEKRIRAALEQIEPPDGAQERMYQHILKKAAAQQPAPKKAGKLVWQRYAALAACLVLVCTAGFFALRGEKSAPVQEPPADMEFSQPPMMAVSPFEDLQSADGFSKLGFTIDAPGGASDVTYCIAYGNTARVDFTLDGFAYILEASAEEPFLDGADETPTMVQAERGPAAVWERDGVQYRLTACSDAPEESLSQLAQQLSQTE